MNQDIRIKIGFFRHPKTIRLRRLLGAEAVLCLQELWCFAAQYHPRGDLTGMDAEAIALASGWPLERAAEFEEALRQCGWIDTAGYLNRSGSHLNRLRRQGLFLHGWEEHQEYVFHAPERKVRAIKANKARRDKAVTARATSTAHSTTPSTAHSTAPSTPPSPAPAPDPDPSPSPSPFPALPPARRAGERAGQERAAPAAPSRRPDPSIVGPRPPRHDPIDLIDAIELEPSPGPASNPEFERFLAAYPAHRRKRHEAERAWFACNGQRPPLEELLAALSRQKSSEDWCRGNGRFIPSAAAWLTDRMWERQDMEPF